MNFVKEINKFNPSLKIEDASMPPASWYTEKEFFNHEVKNIFNKTWQPVAHLSQLSSANSYLTGVSCNIPWLITRDEENKIRGFYNVCRHKGREIVRGSGNARKNDLTCGYHAWKYCFDGQLKSAPQMGGINNFYKDQMGLLPLAVEEWGNWIFINGKNDSLPLSETLGNLTMMLEQRNWSKLQYHSTKEWTINCNWKVYIDNYLDGGYHIPFMHPSLDAQLDMHTYKTVLYENYNIQTSGATSSVKNNLSYDPNQRIGDGSIYAWIFPNFMLNLYGNCLDTNLVLPIDENTCKVKYEFYYHEIDNKEAEDFISTSIKQSDVTQVEDIEICESVQRGLNSGIYRSGRYSPKCEIGEYQFHQFLHKIYSQ